MENESKILPEGVLTFGLSQNQDKDLYMFERRGVIARKTKEKLGLREDEALPSPWTVEIEPTIICNARCHFCSYEAMLSAHREKIIDLKLRNASAAQNWLPEETILDLLKDLKEGGTTRGILWSGGGEPLLWPHIIEASTLASEFADISLQTNGINLDIFSRRAEDLKLLRLISISVVAHDKKLHQEVEVVNSFERVTENVREVLRRKKENGLNITCSAKIIVSQRNYTYLPEIVSYWRDVVGVDGIGIRLVQDYNYGGTGPREDSLELTSSQKNRLVKIIYEKAHNDKLLSQFARVISMQKTKPLTTTRCFSAIDGHFACIDPTGEVFLGNPEIGNQQFSIGNILKNSWKEIWNKPRHREIAQLMDHMQIQGTCDNYLCRHVRANYGVDQYLAGQADANPQESIKDDLDAFL